MATFTLKSFNNTQLKNLDFKAHANWTEDSLYLSFVLNNDLEKIDFGNYHPDHSRKLNLWENTCLEFFIKNQNGHYLEFNFSANFSWNVFTFEEIRGPLKELKTITKPEIDILNSNEKFFLVAKIKKNELPDEFLENNQLSFSFNAVLKLQNRETEYWALKHCDQKPNFHIFESFIGKF